MDVYRVYFEKKAIIFSSTSVDGDYFVLPAAGSGSLSPANLLKKAENHNNLNIISDDTDSTFASFCEHFTLVEAAGGVVENDAGDLLMILRNGMWDFPKGHIECGESRESAAIREVEEETGLKEVELGRFIISTQHFYQMNERWELKRTWWYAMGHSGIGVLEPQAEEGVTQVRWMRGSELWEAVGHSYRTIQDVFAAYLRMGK